MQEPLGEFYAGQGCNFCNGTGYSGRTGVFEVMAVDEQIRKLIAGGGSGQDIRNQAISGGMLPLRRAGMLKAQDRTTTLGEVFRRVFFID
jgi:type II secretory ATPase GspE/PulE/Tfp pilus assembly ATPase PilB-like protein